MKVGYSVRRGSAGIVWGIVALGIIVLVIGSVLTQNKRDVVYNESMILTEHRSREISIKYAPSNASLEISVSVIGGGPVDLIVVHKFRNGTLINRETVADITEEYSIKVPISTDQSIFLSFIPKTECRVRVNAAITWRESYVKGMIRAILETINANHTAANHEVVPLKGWGTRS